MSYIFGQLVRERRIEAGLSLRTLAKASGLSNVELGEVERGQLVPCNQVLASIFRNCYEMAGRELGESS